MDLSNALPGEVVDVEYAQRLYAALPDPDKLLWLVTWLDKANAVVTAYVEHHDETCEIMHSYCPEGHPCGDLGSGDKRDKLLDFMSHKVQDDLRDYARKIKEVQSHG